MESGLTDIQMKVVKNCNNVYFKLLSMIQYSLMNKDKKKLIYKLFKETNDINNYEDKLLFLLKTYINIVGHINLHILLYLGIPKNIIEKAFNVSCNDLDNIEYDIDKISPGHLKLELDISSSEMSLGENNGISINGTKNKFNHNSPIKTFGKINTKRKGFNNFILNRKKRGR